MIFGVGGWQWMLGFGIGLCLVQTSVIHTVYFVNLNYDFKSQFQFLKTLSVIIFPYGIHGNQAIH